jgi:SecD/SecF fusion protein
MAEVLTRSLATSLCTLLPIVALLIFGGATLKDFAFALLVGVASGAYSSIFIASPVLTHWKEREPIYRRRRARIAAENGGVVPAYATTGAAAREELTEQRRRGPRRLTAPTRADGTLSAGEFRELVRDLSDEPRRPEPKPEPKPDPTADARPEDVVMPDQPGRAPRSRGASKSRANRRRGRPR